jgi:hypothetical protein
MRISIGLTVSCVLLLSACTAPGSTEGTSTSEVRTRKKKKKKKKKKKGTVRADLGPTVLFTVKNASLNAVLPKFEEQIGVRIHWRGSDRKLSLRLTRPTPWKDALDLVCQFTKTHPTTDYQGRIVLKDGWGGSLGDDVTIEELAGGTKKPEGAGGTASRGTSGSSGRSASSSSSSSSSGQGGPTATYTKGTKPGEIFGKINRVH